MSRLESFPCPLWVLPRAESGAMLAEAQAELSNTTTDLRSQSALSTVWKMTMDHSIKTKSTKIVRNGSSDLWLGSVIRPITRAIKRYAAPTAIMLLALSTACAPVTRTAHVNSGRPDDATQRQFVVEFDPETLVSNSEMISKLEMLLEGQKLAIDMANVSVDTDLGRITFNLDADSAQAISAIPTQVLTTIASELGIMSELADGGVLLASAGNLFGEIGGGIQSPAIAPTLASMTLARTSAVFSPPVGSSTPGGSIVIGSSVIPESLASAATGSTASDDTGSTRTVTSDNEPIVFAFSNSTPDTPGNSGNSGNGDSHSNANSGNGNSNAGGNVTETQETAEPVVEDTTSEQDSGNGDTSSNVSDDEPLVVVFYASISDTPGNSGNSGNSGKGSSNSAAELAAAELEAAELAAAELAAAELAAAELAAAEKAAAELAAAELEAAEQDTGNSGNGNSGNGGNAPDSQVVEAPATEEPEIAETASDQDSGNIGNGKSNKTNK